MQILKDNQMVGVIENGKIKTKDAELKTLLSEETIPFVTGSQVDGTFETRIEDKPITDIMAVMDYLIRNDYEVRGEMTTKSYIQAANLIAQVKRAGARHSAVDRNLVQQLHDIAMDLGAECDCGKEMMTVEDMRRYAPNPMLKAAVEALILRHPGHPDQKVHAGNEHTIEKVGINQYAIMRKDRQKLGVASSEEAAHESAKRIIEQVGDINRPVSEFPKGTGGKVAGIIGDVEREIQNRPREKRKLTATQRLVRQL